MIPCNAFKCLTSLVRGCVVFVKMCNDNFFSFYLNVFATKDKAKRSLNSFESLILTKPLTTPTLDENANINTSMVRPCHGYDN